MAKQGLDVSDIASALEQMRGETVTECMTAGGFRHTGALHRDFNGILKVFLVHVVATSFLRPGIDRQFRGREDILPYPGAVGVRIFLAQSERKINPSAAAGEILFVQLLYASELEPQRAMQPIRQQCDPLPQAFPIAHHNLAVVEIDIFHAQTGALHQSQAAPVEELGHEAIITVELGKNGADLARGENNRHFGRALDSLDVLHEIELSLEDVLIKEQQSAERLILGGGGNVAIGGKVG